MNKFESYSRFLTWVMALLLSALAAGCGGGGGGQDPILGTGGVTTVAAAAAVQAAAAAAVAAPAAAAAAAAILGAPPGPVQLPGFVCVAAAGPTIPTVLFTDPTNGNQNATTSTSGLVPAGKLITATFSLAMTAATVTNPANFTVTPVVGGVAGVALVPASITYNASTNTATFRTAAPGLPVNSSFTAAITQGATSAAGTPLACSFVWNFKTATTLAAGQAPVFLGSTLSKYGIIAGSTVTNTGPTLVTGASGTTADLGVSPGTAVTGFPPGAVNGTIHTGTESDVVAAKLELTTAYNDAQGRSVGAISLPGNLGGLTLTPGLYVNSSSSGITGTGANAILTLDAQGDADAVFIFKMGSSFGTDPATSIVLSGGAQAKNIFWSVGTSATLGTTSIFKGNILADQSITLTTGAVLDGRALTRIAAVTLDSNPVTKPLP